MRPEKNGKDVAVASGSDSGAIDVLSDDILEHILGFLPAAEAVRTSVLARRWRHRWKFATALNVMCIMESYCYCWPKKPPVEECSKAVDDMLRLRGHTPLEACHLTFGSLHNKEDVPCLNRWVRHVVACQVQRFRLENFDYYNGHLMLDDLSLVSRHLTRLELIGLELNNELCDFSSCPALQHLDIAHCSLWNAKKLSSQSTKSLSITSCNFITESNTLIHIPSLVSLNLDSHLYLPPVLGSMPSLKKAFVRVPVDEDCGYDESEWLDCYSCHIMKEEDNKRFLLDGLSNAENLALLSETTMFIFEKDLKQCPTFNNLKTLLLNDHWCVAPNFLALTCILKHSPVLEKLTLELNSRGPEHKVELTGVYHPMDGSTTKLEHLKAIEVKCEVIDENVHKVLQFLCTFNFCK
ncbi:putative F-box/LRR-repeat protein At4g13960 [Panicum virgatum]|uniref:F-box domain-containing protein n=1 Tax=Panicum virgatum TaxID=38727 RepID=A0A8T0QWZ2_PANVG|nr:putative F-box/LRR-repeat protein At4g13960 [Panicum virgatum]KAG2577445.1 hypothetical protein PVAP13_6NG101400 [Panicum virgatum]